MAGIGSAITDAPADEHVPLDEELEQRFTELAASEDMLDYWAARINPKVVEMEDVKRATMLCIASHGDKFGDRGRLHILLYGDPGTAKTPIAEWVVDKLGALGASMRSSQVGLIADASGGEVVLGVLPSADGSIVCLDELEKFDQKSLQGLLEALESGQVHVDVGRTHEVFDARVRCIACANDTKKLSRELIDRFDFRIEVRKPKMELKKKIMCSRIDDWFREKEGYDGVNMKNYLAWINDHEPGITEAVRDMWKRIMERYLDLTGSEGGIREEESLIRIAITIAKMHRRDVCAFDLLRAIKIRHPNLTGEEIGVLEHIITEE